MEEKKRFCSSCKAGEVYDTPATVKVSGYLDNRPYRAYLCNNHCEKLLSDGYKLKITKLGDEEKKAEVEKEISTEVIEQSEEVVEEI